jgi:hypothetical protein
MKNLTKKKLLIICSVLLLFNLLLSILFFLLDNSGAYSLDGTYIEPKSPALIKTVIMGHVISIPILCMILGSITTIFIDKELPYQKRFIKGFLLTLATVYGLFSVMGIIKVFLFLV